MKGFATWMVVITLVCVVAAWSMPQSPTTPAPVVAAKKASTDAQAKILRLQLQATRVQSQFASCQNTNFQGQYDAIAQQMNAATDEAFKEAKLDKKDWDLNMDTLEFTKKVPAPQAAPKAEEKNP